MNEVDKHVAKLIVMNNIIADCKACIDKLYPVPAPVNGKEEVKTLLHLLGILDILHAACMERVNELQLVRADAFIKKKIRGN